MIRFSNKKSDSFTESLKNIGYSSPPGGLRRSRRGGKKNTGRTGVKIVITRCINCPTHRTTPPGNSSSTVRGQRSRTHRRSRSCQQRRRRSSRTPRTQTKPVGHCLLMCLYLYHQPHIRLLYTNNMFHMYFHLVYRIGHMFRSYCCIMILLLLYHMGMIHPICLNLM